MNRENQANRPESNVIAKRTRHRRKHFTDEIYSARLTFEDARILDDYAKANKLDRSDVVRLGLHQFALRQQMRGRAKDPLREIQEQVIAEQINPIKSRLDGITAMMNEFTNVLIELRQTSKQSADNNPDYVSRQFQKGDNITLSKQQFIEQKQLLERILVSTTLALRLHINYIVEPVLRELGKSELETYLREAERGRDNWSANTREVIKRTGNRILVELNLLPNSTISNATKTTQE